MILPAGKKGSECSFGIFLQAGGLFSDRSPGAADRTLHPLNGCKHPCRADRDSTFRTSRSTLFRGEMIGNRASLSTSTDCAISERSGGPGPESRNRPRDRRTSPQELQERARAQCFGDSPPCLPAHASSSIQAQELGPWTVLDCPLTVQLFPPSSYFRRTFCRKLAAPMREPAGAAAFRRSSRSMLPMKMRSTFRRQRRMAA